MPCECAKFPPLELTREAIDRRIKDSQSLRKRLSFLAANEGQRLTLFRCLECGQFWQSGHEWNFGDKDYIFHVPPTDVTEWINEPYAQPAAMMIYSAVMTAYEAGNPFEIGQETCRAPGCVQQAVKLSVLCKQHHIESLQKFRMLPAAPSGKLFAPYGWG